MQYDIEQNTNEKVARYYSSYVPITPNVIMMQNVSTTNNELK